MGFDYETCGVLTAVEPQSPDISQGVTEGQGLFKEQGAGDQGLMFGLRLDETPELMPAPIMYAHRSRRQLAAVRKAGKVDFLRPDGKIAGHGRVRRRRAEAHRDGRRLDPALRPT